MEGGEDESVEAGTLVAMLAFSPFSLCLISSARHWLLGLARLLRSTAAKFCARPFAKQRPPSRRPMARLRASASGRASSR